MAGYTLSSTASVPPANVRLPFGVPTTPLGFDTVPVKSPTTPVSIATVPPGLTVFVGALRNEHGRVLSVWTAVLARPSAPTAIWFPPSLFVPHHVLALS